MKEVLLLVKEKREIEVRHIVTEYTYYEMKYNEDVRESTIYECLKDHYKEIKIMNLSQESVTVLIGDKPVYFQIIPALRIGSRYFELKELMDCKTEKLFKKDEVND